MPKRAAENQLNHDPLSIVLYLLIILALVFLNGFFVAAEFAIVKVRNTRIDQLVLEGNKRAIRAKTLTDNLDAYLSATQLGITLASLGLGWIGEPTIAMVLSPVFAVLHVPDAVTHTLSFIIAFSVITFLHIVLGELAPKSLAIQKAEDTALLAAPLLIKFHRVMYPFIWLLNRSAAFFLHLIGIEPAQDHTAAHTEKEIRVLMEQSHKSGLIDQTELTLVDNVFEFAERNAREIMIPRTDMVVMFQDSTFEENFAMALNEMHTRYPIAAGDKDNIIGFVHIKDIYRLYMSDRKNELDQVIRPVETVPESLHISDLLKLMQRKRSHMAIVIDEYGGTAGLVTIEDILEEIVGEIQDEFDEERPHIEKKLDDTFSVDGRLLIEEINDRFGLELNSDDYDTIGGWIFSQVEFPPKVGQQIISHGYEFTVTEVDHLRIVRLRMRKLEEEVPDESDEVTAAKTSE
ncbi:hemolysin family protein [Aneurinibacillus sp. Ricciae_BoGa-3]|uniref:hemolysin family protein n=1 Tax=Aneurinibacillus sp. Ricciae_BoGa-3 TaxID=3022697 RepID=UPI002340A8C5|nr:hemolysin family protein [Aneurinibacillus sp. Ricciae_BoGa-3]WCK55932.1 hemolysin family protein [Aneurinibacillus sp. Ricciae_BoGa-3]